MIFHKSIVYAKLIIIIIIGHPFPTVHDRWRRKPSVRSYTCTVHERIMINTDSWLVDSCLRSCTCIRLSCPLSSVSWICWVSSWICEQISETELLSTLKDTVRSSAARKNRSHGVRPKWDLKSIMLSESQMWQMLDPDAACL